MRAQRIKRGFHRIGLVLACGCLIPALVMISSGLYFFAEDDQRGPSLMMIGAAWVPAAIAAYVVPWLIGWIAAGFAGDGEENSN